MRFRTMATVTRSTKFQMFFKKLELLKHDLLIHIRKHVSRLMEGFLSTFCKTLNRIKNIKPLYFNSYESNFNIPLIPKPFGI